MYAAIILVCGLQSPMAVEGCVIRFATKPFVSHDECIQSLRMVGIPQITASLPPKAFVAEATCAPLSLSS